MKTDPANRKDNIAKAKKNIDSSRDDMEAAYEMFGKSQEPTTDDELLAKNEKREDALQGMCNEIRDETKK